MKFGYHKEKYTDLGLIVKHGNTQNIVLFWNENGDAAAYVFELFRLSQEYDSIEYAEGFVEKADIVKTDNYGHHLTTEPAGIVGKKFAVNRIYHDRFGRNCCEVLQFDFSCIKPVTTIQVERNRFYHSFDDLPYGAYIVCMKIENRTGETIAESTPYYFHVDDAKKETDKRMKMLARIAESY